MTAAEAKWSERARQWRESGLSAAELARAGGVSQSTLKWWISRLKRPPSERGSVKMVRVVHGASSAAPIIVTIGAASIAVSRGFDAVLLREIIGALGGGR